MISKINIVIPVWGESYHDRLLNYTLPSLFSPNNFNILNECGLKIYFYCSKSDQKIDLVEEILTKLNLSYEILYIENFFQNVSASNKYDVYGACHVDGIRLALEDKSNLITLQPDAIYTDNYFERIIEILNNNEIVFKNSIRLNLTQNLIEYLADFKNTRSLDLPLEIAKGMVISHIHPSMYQFIPFTKSNRFSPHRLIMFREDTLYMYNADLHPIAIPYEILSNLDLDKMLGAIDDPRCVSELLKSKPRFQIIKNNNHGLEFDLTAPNEQLIPAVMPEFSFKNIMEHFLQLHSVQKKFYTVPVKWNIFNSFASIQKSTLYEIILVKLFLLVLISIRFFKNVFKKLFIK